MITKYIRQYASLVGKVGSALNIQLKQPVFVIGTGRCGTSLLARILSSSPEIAFYPGEANELWHPKLYPFEEAQIESPPIEIDPKTFTELSVKSWPSAHTEKIKQTFNGYHMMAGKSKIFISKSAMISFMMPQIRYIFPDVKFIHIYRYGPSVIASYFKKNFGRYLKYSYTEDEYHRICAKYWNNCILNIEQDKNSLALTENISFFDLRYESLCDDPKGVLKQLSEFLNVEYASFTFDLSIIRNANYKMDNARKENLMRLINDEIYPAMKLKGYI